MAISHWQHGPASHRIDGAIWLLLMVLLIAGTVRALMLRGEIARSLPSAIPVQLTAGTRSSNGILTPWRKGGAKHRPDHRALCIGLAERRGRGNSRLLG